MKDAVKGIRTRTMGGRPIPVGVEQPVLDGIAPSWVAFWHRIYELDMKLAAMDAEEARQRESGESGEAARGSEGVTEAGVSR